MTQRNFGLSSSATRTLYARREAPSSPAPIDWPLIRLLALVSIGTGILLAAACLHLGGVQ